MAGNQQLARDITKLFEMKDTSEPLRKLLQDLISRITVLENKVKALEGN